MLISFLESATQNQIDSVLNQFNSSEAKVRSVQNGKSKTFVILDSNGMNISELETMQGIKSVYKISVPFILSSREIHPHNTLINIDGDIIGSEDFTLIAGPCSVENEKQIFEIRKPKNHGCTTR